MHLSRLFCFLPITREGYSRYMFRSFDCCSISFLRFNGLLRRWVSSFENIYEAVIFDILETWSWIGFLLTLSAYLQLINWAKMGQELLLSSLFRVLCAQPVFIFNSQWSRFNLAASRSTRFWDTSSSKNFFSGSDNPGKIKVDLINLFHRSSFSCSNVSIFPIITMF